MAHDYSDPSGPYAWIAEFETADQLLEAADKARHHGFTKMDAYSPFPIHGLSEAIGFRDTKVPWTVFSFGLIGLTAGYTLQWWTAVIDYPMNVGGRPLNSIPAFIPITYESTILFAAFSAAIGMFLYNKLPQPYHPIFNATNFERASQDRFFLAVEITDPKFDQSQFEKITKSVGAVQVSEVEY